MRVTEVQEVIFAPFAPSERSRHPDIDGEHRYIALIDGVYHTNKMYPVWYGWTFGSIQFDPPGTNSCNWQKLWKVIEADGLRDGEAILLCAGLDPVQIAADDEMRYANERRDRAIKYGHASNGRRITEDSPIEAWLYGSTLPKMPLKSENDEEDDDE